MTGGSATFAPTIIGDVGTRMYGIALAYFQRTKAATSDGSRLTWQFEYDDSFVELTFAADRIVNGTLLNCAPSIAQTLWVWYETGRETSAEDVERLVLGVKL